MADLKNPTADWRYGQAQSITFILTKDCQLACKYCYLVGKNSHEIMNFETAKKAIDYILDSPIYTKENSVIWDFIGGEPFLEIDLLDKICDYIKLSMYRLGHKWFNSFRFSITTNGLNYHTPKVQKFIQKNFYHLSIGITIDGTRNKHDINRVYKNSSIGSYDDVVKNIPLWLSQFPDESTKVTISSEDIPYIHESVLHLFSLGIRNVNMNCVFENVWRDGDDKLFEQQLFALADTIIDTELYKEFSCSIFDESIGKPKDITYDNVNWCGAGKMLAIDSNGFFYPCNRFAKFSLRDKNAWVIGNVDIGVDRNLLRPFLSLDRQSQSQQKCLDCEVASGCAWCQGENYDAADTDTIYQRSTAICKMHKARVRANNYYWNKLFRKLELEGKREEFELNRPKHHSPIC
ncbi:MAG: radical SAM peptide maturase, CXXX-repeat target family [Muribaculaceae bacterium]|nr:radical SAM peptide maturase, CXXX-repeat target family [Muribaculaceae bacterium]